MNITVSALCMCVLVWHCLAEEDDEKSDEDKYVKPAKGKYPFMAVVTSKAGVCSAVIIDQTKVLSAAHCFFFKERVLGPRDTRILAGVNNYDYPSSDTKQETMSNKLYIHPKFQYSVPSKFDVAILQLRDPLEFNEFVAPVNISSDDWPQTSGRVHQCMVLGYGGYLSTAPATADLKAWKVNASHGRNLCPCALRFQAKRLVCVREKANPLMCQGDDGGPLICDGVVRAIGHMVWDRAACGDAMYPTFKCVNGPDRALSLYMFLCPVQDWLHKIASAIPPKPPSCLAPSPATGCLLYASFLTICYFILNLH